MSQMIFEETLGKLLKFRGSKKEYVELAKGEVISIIRECKAILKEQPALIELNAPVNICGDVHGQFSDLLRLFDLGKHPPDGNYLFLGDYVDRGQHSIEVLCLLLIYKIRYPEIVFLLRGNHECIRINAVYGFLSECRSRYDLSVYNEFNELFSWLPLASIVADKIFCCHGGISPELKDMRQILEFKRPIVDFPDEGLACDILWSDPCKTPGWSANSERGLGFLFGEDVLHDFLRKHDLELLCRAHEVVDDGYDFFGDRKCVTLFSAPSYLNKYDNAAAIMHVTKELMCSFTILKSHKAKSKSSEEPASD